MTETIQKPHELKMSALAEVTRQLKYLDLDETYVVFKFKRFTQFGPDCPAVLEHGQVKFTAQGICRKGALIDAFSDKELGPPFEEAMFFADEAGLHVLRTGSPQHIHAYAAKQSDKEYDFFVRNSKKGYVSLVKVRANSTNHAEEYVDVRTEEVLRSIPYVDDEL